MPKLTNCPDPQTLQWYAEGRFPISELDELESHIGQCKDCVNALQSLDAKDTMLSGINNETLLEPSEYKAPQNLTGDLIKQIAVSNPKTEETRKQPGRNNEIGVPEFLSPSEGGDEIGRFGKFRILDQLGKGGMGYVFLAEDQQLKRRVALKVMRPALAASDSARQRFLLEARAIAKMKHPKIISIHETGEEKELPYIAMPVLSGVSLEEHLSPNKTLTVSETLRIGKELLQGLKAAHEQGLIHRDIKPANLFLEGDERRVVLLDFGLARSLDESLHLTQSGAVIGTPHFIAPEQFDGEPSTIKNDLFSVGCVLYRMVTGKLPFPGETVYKVVANVQSKTPLPPNKLNPQVPPELNKLIMKLLNRDPDRRPVDAETVLQRLDEIPMTAGTTPSFLAGKRRLVLAFAAAAVAALVFFIAAAGIIINLPTPDGTVEIHVMEKDVQIHIDGQKKLVLKSKTVGQIEISPGKHGLIVKRGDEELFTKEFTLKSRGKTVIRAKWPTPLDLLAPPAGLVGMLKEELFTGKGISDIKFSVDGRYLICSDIESLGCWDIKLKKWKWKKPQSNAMNSTISPNGKIAATCGWSVPINLFEMESGKPAFKLKWNARNSELVGQALAFSPDNQFLLVSTRDDRPTGKTILRLWDLRSRKEVRQFAGNNHMCPAIAFSPDGKFVFSGGGDKSVRVWVAATGKAVTTEFMDWETQPIAVSPDAKFLVSTGQRGKLQVWDHKNGSLKKRKLLSVFQPKAEERVRGLVFSPNGKHLASTDDNGCISIWNVPSFTKHKQGFRLKGRVEAIDFSPDSRYLAVGMPDAAKVAFFKLAEK